MSDRSRTTMFKKFVCYVGSGIMQNLQYKIVMGSHSCNLTLTAVACILVVCILEVECNYRINIIVKS